MLLKPSAPHHTCFSECSLCLLQGPKDTPFEGGVFEVVLKVPEQYPLVAPNVRFKTKIFHPNVHFKVLQKLLHGLLGAIYDMSCRNMYAICLHTKCVVDR